MSNNHTIRLYAVAAALLALFLTWAAIAAHPWRVAAGVKTNDARLVALAQREQLLRRDMALVQRIAARAAVVAKQSQLASVRTGAATAPALVAAPAPAAAPAGKVVTLPPLVITRTS